MEEKKEKIREPFPPENTPEPPQVMDTSRQPESGTKENEQEANKKKSPGDNNSKEKKLGESPQEIEDETTI